MDGLMETGAMPYCQIVKGKISAKTCAEMQGQAGCFGCAAETRKCEYCKEVMVEIPAVGLCNVCVKTLMDLEGEGANKSILDSEKACTRCHVRAISLKEYKMCLKCSVEEYGRDLSMEGLENNPIKDNKSEKRVLLFSKMTTEKAIAFLPKARKLVIESGNASANFIFKNLKGISYVMAENVLQLLEEEGVVVPSSSKYGRRKVIVSSLPAGGVVVERPKRRANGKVEKRAIELLPEAKALILKHQKASQKLLRKYLGIGHSIANHILTELEAEKFIGPYQGTKGMAISAQSPGGISEPHKPKEFFLDQKVSRLEALISIAGHNSELAEISNAIIRDLIALDEVKRALKK